MLYTNKMKLSIDSLVQYAPIVQLFSSNESYQWDLFLTNQSKSRRCGTYINTVNIDGEETDAINLCYEIIHSIQSLQHSKLQVTM